MTPDIENLQIKLGASVLQAILDIAADGSMTPADCNEAIGNAIQRVLKTTRVYPSEAATQESMYKDPSGPAARDLLNECYSFLLQIQSGRKASCGLDLIYEPQLTVSEVGKLSQKLFKHLSDTNPKQPSTQ